MRWPAVRRGPSLAAVATIALLSTIAACGSSSSTATQTIASPAAATNVASISVDGGPASIANIPFISVTICTPGSTTQCQTVDHIEVDTGSFGLRVISSVLTNSAVPRQLNNSAGNPIVECAQFADGFSWGPVKIADLQIGGESAASIPIQIIGDPAYTAVPDDCSSSGPAENTVSTFGANGVIGVGTFVEDCGGGCEVHAISGTYYACPANAACQSTAATAAQQVSNPVAYFSTDNNGVIVEMPAVASTGSASPTGSLVFGIGTQPNNALGNAKVYTVSSNTGTFTATYKNAQYNNSFIDSGSNANYFVDGTITTCSANNATAPGFYCPASTQSLSATVTGANGITAAIDFKVSDAETLLNNNPANTAFPDLAGPNSDHTSFDFGLPFFFGRNVYTAIESANTPGGIGPYYAF